MVRLLKACFVWVILCSSAMAADSGFFIRDGDRVVFLGDSITEQKLYTTYIEAYTVTRFPKQKFNFWNSGWGGDTAWLRMRSQPDEDKLFAAKGEELQKLVEAAVDKCLVRDVVSFKPTVVTVNFGMNDHGYQAFREDIFRAYIASQTEIAKVLKTNGVRVVLMTPQAREPRLERPDRDASNESLRKFGRGLKGVASKQGAFFIDQFDPYMAIMKPMHRGNTNACIGGGDEVHPGPVGHTLMACIILKAMKAPALVSSAELKVADGKGGTVVRETQCRISNVKYDDAVLSFDRDDDSLPMPVDERATNIVKIAPVMDDVSRYELKVKELKADRYDVAIDGEVVATVAAKELARGWNMAMVGGPIAKQGREVMSLIVKKNEICGELWGAQIRPWRKAERPGFQKQIDDLEVQITAACQPKAHRFELKPVGKRGAECGKLEVERGT